jgi:hypothetical protein
MLSAGLGGLADSGGQIRSVQIGAVDDTVRGVQTVVPEGECIWHESLPFSYDERERGGVSLPLVPIGSMPAMQDHALTGAGQQDRMDALIRRNPALPVSRARLFRETGVCARINNVCRAFSGQSPIAHITVSDAT